MSRPLLGAVLSGALLPGLVAPFAAAPSPEPPQTGILAVRTADAGVGVVATDIPLARILAALSDATGLQVDARVPLDDRVTLDLPPMALPALLDRLLAGHGYLLRHPPRHPDRGQPARLFVLSGRPPRGDGEGEPARPQPPPAATARTERVTTLVQELAAGAPSRRRRAATALATARAVEAGDALADALLFDPDAAVRAEAAYALGRIGGPRWAAVLGRALDNPEPAVREAAIEALADLGDEPAAAALARALSDAEPELQREAVDALARNASALAVTLLEELPGSGDAALAEAAETALAARP